MPSKLGQNFLKNTRAIKKMVGALGVKPNEVIVEIGAGLGAVAQEVVDTYGTKDVEIKAIEIDPQLVDKLQGMFANQDNLEVVEADILSWLPRFDPNGRGVRIIGSLPYYITTPILTSILHMQTLPITCVILIQKEVAQKVMQTPSDSVPISILIQTFFEVESLGTVDRADFTPVPEVDGGILKLTRRDSTSDLDPKRYEGFIKKVFANPRKMINKVFFEDELNRAELDGNKRSQDYGWQEWSKAFRILIG